MQGLSFFGKSWLWLMRWRSFPMGLGEGARAWIRAARAAAGALRYSHEPAQAGGGEGRGAGRLEEGGVWRVFRLGLGLEAKG